MRHLVRPQLFEHRGDLRVHQVLERLGVEVAGALLGRDANLHGFAGRSAAAGSLLEPPGDPPAVVVVHSGPGGDERVDCVKRGTV